MIFVVYILPLHESACSMTVLCLVIVGIVCSFDSSCAGHADELHWCSYCDITIYFKLNHHLETSQHKINFSPFYYKAGL